MILIDNYDSFTYNIVQYLRMLGYNPQIFENDTVTIEQLLELNFSTIIISPGAGSPIDSGISMKVIETFYQTKNILGICLGHQCIAQFFGSEVYKAEPVHGKTSQVFFDDSNDLFKGIPQGFEACRYHSLAVNNVSVELTEIAWTNDGINMALMHKTLPIYGVQFHPEAILTQYGMKLLENFFLKCEKK